ncbi:MAG: hypothetical protein GXP19_04885 [Gammaproteobacteria bacterium]|nr:hypothetical protein [Gammaproteobacteria bacterium]
MGIFLTFPLAMTASVPTRNMVAYLTHSPALAKAVMFLATGNLLRFAEHNYIVDMNRVVQRLPLTAGTYTLAGISIIGVPPSGGFIDKWGVA